MESLIPSCCHGMNVHPLCVHVKSISALRRGLLDKQSDFVELAGRCTVQTMEPATALSAAKQGWSVAQLLQKLLHPDKDISAIEADLTEIYREYVRDVERGFKELRDAFHERGENVDGWLAETREDVQLLRVWRNFTWEAQREAIDERGKMLAAAMLGTLDSNMSVEVKARVERTLRELDPDDVRCLWGIYRTGGHWLADGSSPKFAHRDNVPEQIRYQIWHTCGSADTLVATGCVRVTTHGGKLGSIVYHTASVTPLGQSLIRVLRKYLKERGAPFDVPGRYPEQTPEQALQSWKLINEAGLRPLVDYVQKAQLPRVQYDIPPPGGYSHVPGLPKLIIEGHTSIDRSKLVELTGQLRGDAFRLVMPGSKELHIHGPAEALRTIAEHVDATWA